MDVKGLILIGFMALILSGCAPQSRLTSYDDAGLCALKGKAMEHGNIKIMREIQAEFTRRGSLSISREECDLYMQTGKQNAKVKMRTSEYINRQSN